MGLSISGTFLRIGSTRSRSYRTSKHHRTRSHSVGFIQGGSVTSKDAPELESLGTIFYEPLWLFRRGEIEEGMQALRGRRLSIGPEGSGGRALALQIIEKTRLDSIVSELSGFPPQAAAEKLVAGDIDAAFIVAAWESPVVQSLLHAKGIKLSNAAGWSAATLCIGPKRRSENVCSRAAVGGKADCQPQGSRRSDL